MKMVCKDQEPFFSNSHTFIDLPRIGELLGGDRGKFHIPEDSSKDTVTHLCRSLRPAPPGTQRPVRVEAGGTSCAALRPLSFSVSEATERHHGSCAQV